MNYTNKKSIIKRIGVVTWYRRGHNLGSSLQAYAMELFLKKKYLPEFIDYNQEHMGFISRQKTNIKNIYLKLINKSIINSWKVYDEWINNNIISSNKITNYNQLKNYSKKYDILICGSDQIWNNDLNCDPFYFLRFVEKNKRIAYAPSIGRNYIKDSLREKYKKYISEFEYVSVREEKARDLIKKELKINVEVCLDPTFLLTSEEWNTIAKNNDKTNYNDFIFVYLLEPKDSQFEEIKKYASMINKKVIVGAVNPYYKYNNLAVVMDQFDFLNYIRKSYMVITDSFHGLVFSLLFNKNFKLYKRFNDIDINSQNSRLDDLLSKFNISKDIYICDVINDYNNLNYSKINKIIQVESNKSRDFLMNSIDKITKEKI